MASFTFVPCQGSYVSEWYPLQNFSSSPALFVSRYQQKGDIYRSLLQFDLSSIDSNCTIEKAELILSMYRNEVETGVMELGVHRILNKWTENTSNWNNQPPFRTIQDAALLVYPHTQLGIHTIDISDLVREWHKGSIPNNGLFLMGEEESNGLLAFRSCNYLFSSDWPKLAVKFIEGVLDREDTQSINIPCWPQVPIVESSPVALGPRKIVTFMIHNLSQSDQVKVRIQLSYDKDPDSVFFDSGRWHRLEPQGYPGEAIALSTTEAAEYARVLCWGAGGEELLIYPRSK
jgi:hypothetical protein